MNFIFIRKCNFWLLIGLTLFLAVRPGFAANDLSTFRGVERAFSAGEIDRSEKLVRQMNLFFRPDQISANSKGEIEFLKSGTEIVRDVMDNWSLFSAEEQSLLSALLVRPPADSVYDSPSGFFKIHYSLNGPDYIPPEDNNGNNVPDYAERIGLYCDSSLNMYINHLGYFPPSDDDGKGGDDKYDIYLLALGGYGVTYPDGPADSLWNDYTSFIGIHSSFYGFPANDDPEGDTIGAQKVTSAHEFFHAVQLAYDVGEDLWLMEATATWMEEVVFPDVNDNYNYLYLFFDYPETGVNNNGSYHVYGAFVWPGFLEQKFGPATIRNIWEASRYNIALDAVDSALASYGQSVTSIFPEFTIWNYMTGPRAIFGQYYEAAADYPSPKIERSYTTLPHNAITITNRPEGLGCNYLEYDVGSSRGILEVWFKGIGQITYGCHVIASGSLSDTILFSVANPATELSQFIPYIDNYDEVTVIPAVITPYTVDNFYYVSTIVHLYGDANDDGNINIGDATYLTNFVFNYGADPSPITLSGDSNCDGSVNVADIVYIMNHIFHNGPPPCSSN